jgi:outer membrane protein assembly factor BamB
VSAPVVANGAVYSRTTTALYALDAADGRERWTVSHSAASHPSVADGIAGPFYRPTVADGTVYVVSDVDTHVHALSEDDGTRRWVSRSDRHAGPLTVTDGAVYTYRTDIGLCALRDGESLGREVYGFEPRKATVPGAPVVVDGFLYVVTDAGHVVALAGAAASDAA